jgi:DNA mismatch repair protein PMS2
MSATDAAEDDAADAPSNVVTAATGKIKPIDRASVHRICSGQVIVDLRTAVKELVENAIDAGATKVEVSVTDYGLGPVEVSDNGSGIAAANHASVALKHFTSKLSTFSDLESIVSYGFRGEALSSLCALSSELEITTRIAADDLGARLRFDRNGQLAESTPCARAVGTTVRITGLFRPQPVRFKQFEKHARAHFADLVSLLQAYAVVVDGVRLVGTHRTSKGARLQFISTQVGRQALHTGFCCWSGRVEVARVEAVRAKGR